MAKVVIVGDMTFGESGPPPGGPPLYPDQGLPGRPGRPGRPDYPSQGLPGRPGRPIDPDYGIDEGEGGEAGKLPIWPIGPEHGLPPIAGLPLPPTNPPPGTIWPPLPPSIPAGKTLVYAGIVGVGKRYIVVDVPPPKPDQGFDPDKTSPEHHNRRR